MLLCLLAGTLAGQVPVLRFAIYDGEKAVDPRDPAYEVWMQSHFGGERVLLQAYDPDSVFLPYAHAHRLPGAVYEYELFVCQGEDTMAVHFRTWYVDWYEANFLIPFRSGRYCFDMKEARKARNGINPVNTGPFLRRQEGECFSP